jgi:hypothetical protein
MEQKDLLQHLVAIRTLILDSVPPLTQSRETYGGTAEEQFNENLKVWNNASYNEGFKDCKTFAINIINKEINSIIGVDIIGMKTCNQKPSSV